MASLLFAKASAFSIAFSKSASTFLRGNLRPQEIRPQEFAEPHRILGVAAGTPQFARKAAERIVLQFRHRLWIAGKNLSALAAIMA